ncbi:CHAT domain-containing protein [Leptothoe sp. LEGE 181152]|nr:CHAT domain-containing protein [Leptothoe sp. LEGE 181152]
MVRLFNRHHTAAFLITLVGSTALTTTAQAQSITPADPATTVQQAGNQYQIDGGNLSGDNTILFHSFDQFGLLTGEAAQFSNPAVVENIIGRVIGGDSSIIDGLLSVGGDANLYLVNPAGVLFGENAQLNLGGSFSASTATGLAFGSEVFDALGTNDFNLFSGAPTGYVFANEVASAVVNTGNLAVTAGQSLTLLGGQVINTGQLSAPNGEILVMAVPGENRVRLSQTGSLLGLELETLPETGEPPGVDFAIATIPALLTGAADLGMATDITVNPDGTVSLSGSSLQTPVEAGTALVSGQLEADNGGNIGILGEQIALVDASVDASGETGGGTVLIGGDQLGQGSVPNATTTFIDETSVVRADARDNGDGGKIVAWGTNLLRIAGQLFARGGNNGGDGGFIETSGLTLLDIRTTPDITAANGAGGLWLLDPANIRIVDGTGATNVSPTNPFEVGALTTDATLGVELIESALAEGGNIEVRTTGDTPGEGNIILEVPLDYDNADADSSLRLIAEGEIQILADITDGQATRPEIRIGPDEVPETFEVPDPNDLDLTLEANEQITVDGDISLGDGTLIIESFQGDINVTGNLITSSGDVDIQASEGSVTISTPIQTAQARLTESVEFLTSPLGGGDITIQADGAVNINNIVTSASSAGGDIFIESQTSIQVGEIDTSTLNGSEIAQLAGNVDLIADSDIVFSSIDASSATAEGGEVNIESFDGFVRGIGVLLPSSTTILTEGGNTNGNITISHNGGSTETPFIIGGGSAVNGTEGDITTGTLTLSDVVIEEPFDGGEDIGNIKILTEIAPSPPPPPPPPEEPEEPDNVTDPLVDEDVRSNPLPVDVGQSGTSMVEQQFSQLEDRLTSEFNDYLQLGLDSSTETVELVNAQRQLLTIQQQTGKRPALIYAVFGLDGETDEAGNVLTIPDPSAPLELFLITAEGDPVFIAVDVTRQEILTMAQRLRRQVSIPTRAGRRDTSYLRSAQQLYQWLIAPIQTHLESQNIDTLSFVTDAGLRSLPLATLHDGENFIIQNYNIGLMPSLSLTDLTYQDISNVSALVAGTSTFVDQAALPGVPVELDAIASEWTSKVLEGSAFSVNQLKGERQQSPYGIIHLATHGEFNVGDLSKSYLYLYNERLSLDQMRTLGLNQPPVELLTLSACQTALGNRSAELGFAGFAVLAGAKTSIASLWNVSDAASAALMIEFYRQLQESQPIIKADALRQAQLAMIRGDIFVDGDQLKGLGEAQKLPVELVIEGQRDFSHPYYWAAFSLVGSPW